MNVPSTTSLQDIYPEDAIPAQEKRWANLFDKFKTEYGRPADFVSRSPGRVNLIGEHIDYMLYQVFPMAVTADVIIAVGIHATPAGSLPQIRVANIEGVKFPRRDFKIPLDGIVEVDHASPDWSNYFKAGLSGVLPYLRESDDQFVPVSMDVLVHGNVPTGSGLSSSTAFVCASALAVMAANGVSNIDKKELCERTIASERAVGTIGGGMDQVASIFSLSGSATYVSFVPELTAEPVEFPVTEPGFSCLVAHSYVDSFKAVTAPVCYNLRVVECTMATDYLSKSLGLKKALPSDASPLGRSLRGLQNTYFEEKDGRDDNFQISPETFEKQLEKLVVLVEQHLPQEEGYTRQEIAKHLDITVDELTAKYMSRHTVRADRFKLRQRALHVFSEALRVLKFRSLMSSTASTPADGQLLLQSLGNLLNEAQASCKNTYECSCEELDELCSLALEAGAYGSRLTGAGWGGCSVHLVPSDKVEDVKKAWIEKYYKKRWPDKWEGMLEEGIVVSKPGSGSYLYKVEDVMFQST
ncbi:Galactokinase [Tothia fuscella]|uniref:Galactokinase n=1 Tax=Tothia fuscella TaxID=1048955 RepID=A0A9P4P0G5_9PEZI|nr:Galactokinase [Tothia fuscella]